MTGWAYLEMKGVGAAASEQRLILLAGAGNPELGRQVIRSLLIDFEVEEAWSERTRVRMSAGVGQE